MPTIIFSATRPTGLQCPLCHAAVEAEYLDTAPDFDGIRRYVWGPGPCRNPQCSRTPRSRR
ncbi:hypothetical protein ACIA8O_22570 [Kitasatospora sp. NPDC051853]|uniref:hypothetical protein n=1 Tax=Kitasatospora sp. NPDC051853 TaxID=3364058 RepID=UPI0037B420CF